MQGALPTAVPMMQAGAMPLPMQAGAMQADALTPMPDGAAMPAPVWKMPKAKTEPAQVWGEYNRGRAYNNAINLYDTVEENENIYIGNQWEGVNAPNLDKPVLNITKRVVTYQESQIVSDDIGISVKGFGSDAEEKAVGEMLGDEFDRVMELTDFKRKNRDVIRNASVDGDACMHFFWHEPEGEQQGSIKAEMLENTCVYFGNREVCDVQKQPFIIISFRRMVDEAKREAAENGCDPEAVNADENEDSAGRPSEDDKVTVLRKYYKQDGHIWYTEVTSGAVLKPPTDSGLERYPLAWMVWEKRKDSYHGQACITGLVPNQRYINKLMAMAMRHVSTMAFPKTIYNKTMIKNGWDNRVGAAIGVTGDPNVAIASGYKAPDMSAQVLELLNTVITTTRDTMGASDAALGNVNPDNTSAIIATQQATAMPLELQKMDYYAFVEDCVRIWLDMMSVYYGVRTVEMRRQQEAPQAADAMAMQMQGAGMAPAQMPAEGMDAQEIPPMQQMQPMQGAQSEDSEAAKVKVDFDFSALRGANLRLAVDIGAATYWSELQQVQTLDALYASKVISDPVVYLEQMPKGYIPGKEAIVESIKRQQAQQEAMQQQAMAMQATQTQPAPGEGEMMQ